MALEWIWIIITFAEERHPNIECDTERKPPPIWLHGCCLGKLTSRVHAAIPMTMADVLLCWPKGLQVSTTVYSPGAHEAEISRHKTLNWSEVPSCAPPTPSLHPSPGSQPQAPLSMPGISHISLREYPLKKAAFLTGHVSGYRSIKICDIDVEMTWLAVSGYIKGSTLVIIIALVWVSGLQPRGEMWVFKMKTSFLCRKYSNTSCFLTVLQLVWFLPCHPIWVRIMQQAREKRKPVWSWKSITGVGNTQHDSYLHFLGAKGEWGLQMLCRNSGHWLCSMHVSYSWTLVL